jgi:hypothetical protein
MLLVALLCTDASLANMLLDTDCRRRRIHACHMRRRIHVARHRLQEEEDTCMSHEEEDTCCSTPTAAPRRCGAARAVLIA